jgi:hypothetical protein
MIFVLAANFNSLLQICTNVLIAKGMHSMNASVVQAPLLVKTALEKSSLSN